MLSGSGFDLDYFVIETISLWGDTEVVQASKVAENLPSLSTDGYLWNHETP